MKVIFQSKGLFTRTVSVSVSVSLKVYHCVNGDGPFDGQNGFCTHPLAWCKPDGDGTCKQALRRYPPNKLTNSTWFMKVRRLLYLALGHSLQPKFILTDLFGKCTRLIIWSKTLDILDIFRIYLRWSKFEYNKKVFQSNANHPLSSRFSGLGGGGGSLHGPNEKVWGWGRGGGSPSE